jgi:hypothetical protein
LEDNFRTCQKEYKGVAFSFARLGTDRRGAVALEMPIVFTFIMFSLLFPLADVAIAGFQFISAHQAMRDLGQWLQYHLPPDVTITNTGGSGTWLSSAQSAGSAMGGSFSNLQVLCGTTLCSASNPGNGTPPLPKYYTFSTTVTVAPMVLTAVLCPGGNCSYTLTYSERFQ